MATKTIILLLCVVVVACSMPCNRPSEFQNSQQVREYLECIKLLVNDPRYGKRSFPDYSNDVAAPKINNDYNQPYDNWVLYNVLKYGEKRI